MNNLIYSSTILIVSLLGDGYQIKLSSRSLISCKLVTYFGTLLSALSPSFIVFASIDRWCASSSSIQRRNFSNVRTAKWLIFIIIIFFSFLFIISLVTAGINANDTLGCRTRGDVVFVQAYGIFQFILFSCLAPILMLVFGCMTIYNVQLQQMVTLILSSNRRTETQLARMLLVQVGVQILLNLPLCAVGLLLSFPSIYQPTASFYSIYFICRVIFHISYATPFFLYFLSARMFRKELTELIFKSLPWQNHNRVHVIRRIGVPTYVQTNTHPNETNF
ncbi:unnamed protein product [Rotaria sp. Silwood2]|nr:unnamed protein product [Rotaria sp. Silwood2]CAF2811685.1 unnamed protein product [Rotaria sp. Silwood2]CAF3895872.1 unnamed protein product [Rotaria sp. Silwood2]CAF3963656.1 unnamed protein product [Rotaria sp. Silwood2]